VFNAMTDAGFTKGLSRSARPGVEDLDWFEVYRPAPPMTLDLAGLADELASMINERVKRGQRVGVGVGSRGIARLPDVVAVVVGALRAAGVDPVLIPAMGSHGGATGPGQVEVLRELGVVAEALEVPVDASMEVEQIGHLGSGRPVYVGKAALACDVFVPIGRVKPHTDFRARVESGLTKMLTIGLGKERGASSLHGAGFASFAEVLPEALQLVLGAVRVPFGVALVEDAWHRLWRAEVVPGEDIFERDEALLKEAWDHLGRLPFEQLDVLVLKEMGKTVSGAGMDPNVTGRFPGDPLPAPTSVARLAVLDLREDSGGNAQGVGVADVVTERLRNKVNWGATYANAVASKTLAGAKLPVVAHSDAIALSLVIESLVGRGPDDARVVAMVNTLEVSRLAVSLPLVELADAAGYETAVKPVRAEFAEDGRLVRIGSLEFFAD
jgi:Lactate racemase N-terminal domain